MDLTELDKKILFQLDLDGRASYSQIGRAIGTTPQVVKYHVENLLSKGTIQNFWAFVDYEKAGYSFFWAYWLKFAGLTKQKEEEIYSYFKQAKNMPIVMRCSGYADAMICITTKDVFSHNEILKDYSAKFGKYIAMIEMVVGLGFESYPRSYLLNQENKERLTYASGGAPGFVKISETEKKLLSLLQMEGRMEFVKVADFLGISVSYANETFKKLTEKGVINKTAMTLGYASAEIKAYRCLFRLLQFDEKRLAELHDFCVVQPNIKNYVPVMGNWQLMLDIEVENDEQLADLIRKMRYDFKDVIYEVAVAEIKKIEKFSQMVIEYPELLEKKAEFESNEEGNDDDYFLKA